MLRCKRLFSTVTTLSSSPSPLISVLPSTSGVVELKSLSQLMEEGREKEQGGNRESEKKEKIYGRNERNDEKEWIVKEGTE